MLFSIQKYTLYNFKNDLKNYSPENPVIEGKIPSWLCTNIGPPKTS